MTSSSFDAPLLEPIARQIETFLQGRRFSEGAYIGSLSKPVLRVLIPHFQKQGSLGVTAVCDWGCVPAEVYQEQDDTVRGWLDLLGTIWEGTGPVDLLVWEGRLTRSDLNGRIRSIRQCLKPSFKADLSFKFPAAIILIGEAAKAAGHPLYQWTRSPGLALGC
jgi:hypothetical protein